MSIDLKSIIRTVPDFPSPGILFYDIGSLLANAAAWQQATQDLIAIVKAESPDILVAIEARGFLIAAPIAVQMGLPLAMVRKSGKLPGKTIGHGYDLEYGSDTIEMQEGVIKPGARAVLIDDLLATGGTAAVSVDLARQLGANVTRAAFVIELTSLKGREKVGIPVSSLLAPEK